MTRSEFLDTLRAAANTEWGVVENAEGFGEALKQFGQSIGLGLRWNVTEGNETFLISYFDQRYSVKVPKPKKVSSVPQILGFWTTPDGDWDEQGNLR